MLSWTPPPAFYRAAALLLVCFAFMMSALVSRTVFERLPHLEDEVAYLYQARIFARGDVVIDTPEPRRAYWQPFVVDYAGARFGKYTPGWPLLLAGGELLGQAWLINALLAALTVALVYRLGRELFNEDAGLVAAALAAFSPAALLLNASLMGHTAALFFAVLFMYSYWRLEKGRRTLFLGALAGFALGMLVINRPLSAVGVALPFIAWSGIWLLRERARLVRVLPGLLALCVVTLLLAAAIPLFNAAATGDPAHNLYTLVWPYDRIGFGECCGRSGHTLERALAHARYDLSLAAADLFGWQPGPVTPELQEHLRTRSDSWPAAGLSFVLLPFGLLLGLPGWPHKLPGRRHRLALLAGWTGVFVVWLLMPGVLGLAWRTEPASGWLWVGGALLWLLLPLAMLTERRARWTWLLFSMVLGLVLVQMTYWIGSQRYSTRYYYEALAAAALLTALPLAWLAQRARLPLYAGLAALLLWSLYSYSTPRIEALHGFNFISRDLLEEIETRRESEGPLLVIVNGADVRWRAMGTLMAVTNPYLDSDIVVAWDYQVPGVREGILARLGDRQIIEMDAIGNEAWFRDD